MAANEALAAAVATDIITVEFVKVVASEESYKRAFRKTPDHLRQATRAQLNPQMLARLSEVYREEVVKLWLWIHRQRR